MREAPAAWSTARCPIRTGRDLPPAPARIVSLFYQVGLCSSAEREEEGWPARGCTATDRCRSPSRPGRARLRLDPRGAAAGTRKRWKVNKASPPTVYSLGRNRRMERAELEALYVRSRVTSCRVTVNLCYDRLRSGRRAGWRRRSPMPVPKPSMR